MKKKRWWLIPAAFISAVLLIAALFWQTLLLYIAPNLVLAGALKDRLSELETRLSASPISVLARGFDPDGRNQVDLQLQTENELIGPVRYDMHLQVVQNPRRILATGRAAFQSKEMDLSVYLDNEFAAVSSEGVLNGNYYGLRYDTFSQDIRSNKWISLLIGESVLRSWESKIDSLQRIMQGTSELPDVSGIDFKNLAMGVLALDADVERHTIDSNGKKEVYHVISYEASGAEIASGLAYLNIESPAMLSPDDEVEISFWMQDGQICKAELDTEERGVELYWGIAPVAAVSPDDLYVQYFDDGSIRTMHIRSVRSANILQETITYTADQKAEIAYQWNASSGDLSINVDAKGENTQLELKLVPKETGFSLQTEDFGALMQLLTDTQIFQNNPCTMTVTKGSDFETPEYKNFVDCSLEDLLTLLSGIGSLIGIKLP